MADQLLGPSLRMFQLPRTRQQQVPNARDLMLFTRVSLCLVSSRYQPPFGSRGQGAAIIKSASQEGEGWGRGEGRSAGMR